MNIESMFGPRFGRLNNHSPVVQMYATHGEDVAK